MEHDEDNIIYLCERLVVPLANDPSSEASPDVDVGMAGLEVTPCQSAPEVRFAEDDAMEFVREYLAHHSIEVMFDGSLFFEGVPLRADSREMVDSFLSVEILDISDVADQMILHAREHYYVFKKGDIDRALRQVVRQKKHSRRNTVMRPLLREISAEEKCQAEHHWRQLGEHVFEMDPELAVAILQHFVWQVKQKLLGRTVVHHLMPVIVSQIQGSGKTTFVQKFLGPLRELATGAALLSDFADRRNLDIFRFLAVLIDDMERIEPANVPILKALLTADGIRRRKLGTSMTVGVRQAATPIGTANTPVERLVADETGHRRFAMLPFRNGQSAKGGSEKVWEIVTSADYALMWTSVDAFAPSPIVPLLESLFRHQGKARPSDSLLSWLRGLDLKSEPMLRITVRQGVRAQELHTLFNAQAGAGLTSYSFAKEMERHFHDPEVPFDYKVKTEAGAVYHVKRRASDKSNATGPENP